MKHISLLFKYDMFVFGNIKRSTFKGYGREREREGGWFRVQVLMETVYYMITKMIILNKLEIFYDFLLSLP